MGWLCKDAFPKTDWTDYRAFVKACPYHVYVYLESGPHEKGFQRGALYPVDHFLKLKDAKAAVDKLAVNPNMLRHGLIEVHVVRGNKIVYRKIA